MFAMEDWLLKPKLVDEGFAGLLADLPAVRAGERVAMSFGAREDTCSFGDFPR